MLYYVQVDKNHNLRLQGDDVWVTSDLETIYNFWAPDEATAQKIFDMIVLGWNASIKHFQT